MFKEVESVVTVNLFLCFVQVYLFIGSLSCSHKTCSEGDDIRLAGEVGKGLSCRCQQGWVAFSTASN